MKKTERDIMSNKDMTEKRFKEIVASYGTAPARWPEGERSQAIAFLAQNQSAKTALEEAASTDGFLNLISTPKPADQHFLKRLASTPPPRQALESKPSIAEFFIGLMRTSLQGFMPRAVGLASICALGIMLGLSNVARVDNAIITVDAGELIFGTASLENDLEEIN